MPPSGRPRLVYLLEYPIAFGGGVSVLVRALIEQLAGEYELFLVSPDTPETLAAAGVGPWLSDHFCWGEGRASRARARRLAEKLLHWRVELAHFHLGGNFGWGNRRPGTSPIPRLARAGVRCVTTVHYLVSPLSGAIDPASPWWKHGAAAPIAWLGRVLVLRHTAVEITVSERDRRLLERWYRPLRGKWRALYHSRLPAAPSGAPPMAGRRPVVLQVGHRAPRKGQEVLVEAFGQVAARFPEWRLVLVGPPGEQEYEARLRALAEAAGVGERVEVRPGEPGVFARMQEAAVYVQPARHEGLPLSLQEAMYEGCACLSTAVGGVPEMLRDGAEGLLVPPGEVGALAEALARLLEEGPLRERLGEGARAAIRERGFHVEAMAQRHRALYEEVLHAG